MSSSVPATGRMPGSEYRFSPDFLPRERVFFSLRRLFP